MNSRAALKPILPTPSRDISKKEGLDAPLYKAAKYLSIPDQQTRMKRAQGNEQNWHERNPYLGSWMRGDECPHCANGNYRIALECAMSSVLVSISLRSVLYCSS